MEQRKYIIGQSQREIAGELIDYLATGDDEKVLVTYNRLNDVSKGIVCESLPQNLKSKLLKLIEQSEAEQK